MNSYLRGGGYFGRAGSAVGCVINDISDSGARLRLLGPPPVVDTIELHIPIKRRVHRAKVLWAAAHEIGVAFIEATTTSVPQSDVDDLSRRIIVLRFE
jgi:PilZ domain-containing protein